ncbi:hypothetical protein U1Q18_006143 [Sarracenia purpurea var. burkii]
MNPSSSGFLLCPCSTGLLIAQGLALELCWDLLDLRGFLCTWYFWDDSSVTAIFGRRQAPYKGPKPLQTLDLSFHNIKAVPLDLSVYRQAVGSPSRFLQTYCGLPSWAGKSLIIWDHFQVDLLPRDIAVFLDEPIEGDGEEAARLTQHGGLGQQKVQKGSPKKSLNRQSSMGPARKESRDSRGVIHSCESKHLHGLDPVADSPPAVCEISGLDPDPSFSVQNPAKAMMITHQSKFSSSARSPRSDKARGIEARNGKSLLNSKPTSLSLGQSTEKSPDTFTEENLNGKDLMKAPVKYDASVEIEGSVLPFNSYGKQISEGNGEKFPFIYPDGIKQLNGDVFVVKGSPPTKAEGLEPLPLTPLEPALSNPSLRRRKKWARHVRPTTLTDPNISVSTKRKLTEVGNSVSTDNLKKLKAQDVSPDGDTEALPYDMAFFSQTAEAAVQPCRSL